LKDEARGSSRAYPHFTVIPNKCYIMGRLVCRVSRFERQLVTASHTRVPIIESILNMARHHCSYPSALKDPVTILLHIQPPSDLQLSDLLLSQNCLRLFRNASSVNFFAFSSDASHSARLQRLDFHSTSLKTSSPQTPTTSSIDRQLFLGWSSTPSRLPPRTTVSR